MKRSAIALAASISTILGVLASTAAASDGKIIAAAPGIPPIFASVILYVAKDQGLFKKYGVDVEVKPFDTGSAAARAIIAGSVDLSMSPSALIINQVSNTDAPLVAIYGIANSDMVLASSDASSTSCKDIVGQTVGVDAIGGARSIALQTMLAGGCPGVTIDQVKQVALSSNVGPAMIADTLKFGVLHLDDVATIEAAGTKLTQIISVSKASPNGHYLMFVVNRDKLRANRDAYVRALAALISAAKFIHDPNNADQVATDAKPTGHTESASKATIKPLLDIDYWPVSDDGLDKKRLEALIGVMKKAGGIKPENQPVAYDRLVDQSVWRDANKLVSESN
jgi:ABC-type nitrate/sulfonate/bicarbonate transport system substrate-binding protein